MARRPNTRMQRTRSSASPPRSPLTRKPLGVRTITFSRSLGLALTLLLLVSHSASGDTAWEAYVADPTPHNASRVNAIEYGGAEPQDTARLWDDLGMLEVQVIS